jgi:thiol-disulfide isomerase/thioredoxin
MTVFQRISPRLFIAAASLVAGVLLAGVASRQLHAKESEPEAESVEELTAVPKGADSAELLKFIEKLARTPSQGENKDEKLKFNVDRFRAIVKAANQILADKSTGKAIVPAVNHRLRALQYLVQLGDPGADDELNEAITQARADKRLPIAAAGWEAYLQAKISNWDMLSDQAKSDLAKEIVAAVKTDGPSELDVMLVRAVAFSLERSDDAFVVSFLNETIPLLQESKNRKVKSALAESNLVGMLRRMNLMGRPIEISGTLLDGNKVDWDSYRGKVVLVDFWATWCGPCRAEVPNILNMYAAYHDKGFEVLGVSLDSTTEKAEKYVDEMGIPWPSLFSPNEDERGWDNPLARYYGITGIPTAILVDQEGNVVHMDARGPHLRHALQELLGDPLDVPGPDDVGDTSDDAGDSGAAARQ